jgi:hypothetical protein
MISPHHLIKAGSQRLVSIHFGTLKIWSLLGLSLIWALSAFGQLNTRALLYGTNDLRFSPTNMMRSNVLAGANVGLTYNARGGVTISVTNGVAAVWTNGVAVGQATNIHFIWGTNVVLDVTNVSGRIDIRVNAAGQPTNPNQFATNAGILNLMTAARGTNAAFWGAGTNRGDWKIEGGSMYLQSLSALWFSNRWQIYEENDVLTFDNPILGAEVMEMEGTRVTMRGIFAILSGAVSNAVWVCTNATTGAGEWRQTFQPATGNLTNWSNIATGAMANIPSVDHLTNWANSISNLAQTKMAALDIMTNAHGVAGGIRAGLGTNQVWKFPPWASFATNYGSSNTVEITVKPHRPFAIVDATNIFYEDVEWQVIMDEEFLGDSQNTIASPANNIWNFNQATSGTAPTKQAPPLIADFAGVGSFSHTAVGGRLAAVGGATIGQMALTNCEVLGLMRVRYSHTNDGTDTYTMRAGLIDANTAIGEWNNGVYLLTNTNANTNSVVCVTARASTRTLTYTTVELPPNTFRWWGYWLDRTGTNMVFIEGPALTNLTSFATNTQNIVGLNALVTPAWEVQRFAGSGARTNYIERYFLARKKL